VEVRRSEYQLARFCREGLRLMRVQRRPQQGNFCWSEMQAQAQAREGAQQHAGRCRNRSCASNSAVLAAPIGASTTGLVQTVL
jgi:hypothetical protein